MKPGEEDNSGGEDAVCSSRGGGVTGLAAWINLYFFILLRTIEGSSSINPVFLKALLWILGFLKTLS